MNYYEGEMFITFLGDWESKVLKNNPISKFTSLCPTNNQAWCMVYWYINTISGTFENGSMTGNGVYYLADGGKFDSSVGLYYPDREDASVFHEAHFDGQHLRYKEAQPARQTQGGY